MNQYQYLDADFAAENGQLGCIGYMEEQRYRALRVQVGDVLAAYPDAVFHCAVLRAGEKHPYRMPDDALAVENGVLIVPLGKAEYACPGLMEMQISFDAGDVSGRSVLYQAVVGKSLVSDAGDPQSPYADALRDMDAAIARMDAFVAAGGQVPEESIRQAVTAYLAENPVEEKDPTVPAWAKEAEKPGYTADEVGAIAREGRNVQNANIAFGAVTTGILADKAVTAAKIADGVIPAAYTLPVATAQTLGGVKPVAKTEDMTQSVGVDQLGGLWALPGGGSGGDSGGEATWNIISEGVIGESVSSIIIDSTADGAQLSTANAKELLIFGKLRMTGDTKVRFEAGGWWSGLSYFETTNKLGAWGAAFMVHQRMCGNYKVVTQVICHNETRTLFSDYGASYPSLHLFEIHASDTNVQFDGQYTEIYAYYR